VKKFWGSHPKGEWELHPCQLPTWEDISTEWTDPILGNVWKCECGRRWRVMEMTKINYGSDYVVKLSYTEQLDITDDTIDIIEAWANQGATDETF
jgi:hypothetical protein